MGRTISLPEVDSVESAANVSGRVREASVVEGREEIRRNSADTSQSFGDFGSDYSYGKETRKASLGVGNQARVQVPVVVEVRGCVDDRR